MKNKKINETAEKKILERIEKKESEKEIGYDCSCCDFACKLPNKDLQNDFVFCGNPDCKFHYHVLFEHFHCKPHEDEENDNNENYEDDKKDENDEIIRADFKEILHKNFPSAVCQHCKKATDIQFSNDFRKLISRNRTLSEMNKAISQNWRRWMNIKNGQIEAMHKMIARLVELIPEEQKKKAKEITHEMRDEIKHAEKRLRELKNE